MAATGCSIRVRLAHLWRRWKLLQPAEPDAARRSVALLWVRLAPGQMRIALLFALVVCLLPRRQDEAGFVRDSMVLELLSRWLHKMHEAVGLNEAVLVSCWLRCYTRCLATQSSGPADASKVC